MLGKSLIKSKERNDNVYNTPVEYAKDCVKYMSSFLKEGDTILDPCRGTGNFYNNYPEGFEKDWCEISEDRDFYNTDKPFDWIITNPPFQGYTKWLEHSCKIAQRGFGYIVPSFSITNTTRCKILDKYGFYIHSIIPTIIRQWFGYPVCFTVYLKGVHPQRIIKDTYVIEKEIMDKELHKNSHFAKCQKKSM